MSDWRERGIEADVDAIIQKTKDAMHKANLEMRKPLLVAVVIGTALVFINPLAGATAGTVLVVAAGIIYALKVRRIKKDSNVGMMMVTSRAADRLTSNQASAGPIE